MALLESIPQDVVAKAAQQCGAHARALLYYETYVRALRGGARNPAAHKSAQFADEEVTFLQVMLSSDPEKFHLPADFHSCLPYRYVASTLTMHANM